jgi:hypothetical protein
MKPAPVVLSAYAAVAATVALGLAVAAFVRQPDHETLKTLDVGRINVREPDGTLRMTLSNRAAFPGMYVHGKEYTHANRASEAGLIFLNDEGTENGGLIFDGAKVDGKVSSAGHLSFDQYDQDQVVTLEQTEDNGDRDAGLTIADRPDAPMDFAGLSKIESQPDGQAQFARMRAAGAFGRKRLFMGKSDGNSEVTLKDGEGRPRLRLLVTHDGAASITFLDEAGKPVRTVTP